MNGVEIYAPREEHHRRTWTLAAILLIVIFVILGGLTAVGLAQILQGNYGRIAQADRGVFELTFFFGFAGLLCLLWVWLFERRGVAQIGFTGGGAIPFLRGLFWGLAALASVIAIIAALGGYSVEASGRWAAPSAAVLLPFAAYGLAFIIQGSTEELLIRGWLMQLTASRHGVTAGIVLSTVVFSLLHGANIKPSDELILGLLNIVLVGVLLGLYAAQEGSIWGVCGWHAAWNWLLGLGFGLEVSGGELGAGALVVDLKSEGGVPWWITGGAFGPEASVITTGVLLAGCLWLLFKGPKVT
jgi:uncharacterized protein